MRGDVEGEDSSQNAYNYSEISTLHSAGYNGQGIIIGMLESGVPNTNNQTLTDAQARIEVISNNAEVSKHATMVASIINKFAPEFEKLYNATCNTNVEMIISIEALLSKNVNLINMSWGMQNPETALLNTPTSYIDNEYSFYAKWIDHIAYNHSVHMIIASGNYGKNRVSSNAMAYNAIAVGAVDNENTITYFDDISWIASMPIGVYFPDYFKSSSYNSIPNLPYKPDICAHGAMISVPGTIIDEGTSFAAPQITGIIASLAH